MKICDRCGSKADVKNVEFHQDKRLVATHCWPADLCQRCYTELRALLE